jgi:DNA-binding XRE family transcriptional regulator
MSNELAKKMRLIRETETNGRAEFSERIGLAKKTLEGIEQTGRVPKGDLLEKVCQEWPKYTLWLMTGQIATEAGQVNPAMETTRSELVIRSAV